MDNFQMYLLLGVLVLFMNIIPAFMPPTWTVLAFFYTAFDMQLVPVVIIGAICATLGRVILALLVRHVFSDYIPKKLLANYQYLGDTKNSVFPLSSPMLFFLYPQMMSISLQDFLKST
jgi:hypothetical protein